MQAIGVIPHQRDVRILDHAPPSLSSGHEVKVKSLDVGICGTDREICTFVYGSPPQGSDYLVLGHESLGEVVEIGDAVTALKPGDLVVPSVRRPCPHDHCQPCRAGQQDFCATGDFVERGIKMNHGFMTEFYVDEERHLNYVPPALRDVAVLVEPLTVAEKALAQVWQIQRRFPWTQPRADDRGPGHGLRAVVLGAGPIGILGTMACVTAGFETYVYSRSPAPNPKAELVEAVGARYLSTRDVSVRDLAELVGNIDLVYEGIGVAELSFQVLEVLGLNGVFVFTGIPAPKAPVGLNADLLMRNLVLKNQVVLGTVNADRDAFQNAIRDLEIFMQRWPDPLRAIITGRHKPEAFRSLLLGKATGIKNIIAFD